MIKKGTMIPLTTPKRRFERLVKNFKFAQPEEMYPVVILWFTNFKIKQIIEIEKRERLRPKETKFRIFCLAMR